MWQIWNGKKSESIQIELNNRSFRYGDGLFESLRLFNGKIFNRINHENRLRKSLFVLKLDLEIDIKFLFDSVEELAQINGFSNGSSARISVYREGEGLYTPEQNQASYIIQSFELPTNSFCLNKEGLHVGFYSEFKKQKNLLSNIKSANGLLYVLASVKKKELSLDELILLNDSERVAEFSSSNLCIVADGVLVTPPLTEAPLDGCMRKLLIDSFNVVERPICKDDLMQAQEVFLCNSKGLKWVSKIEDKDFSEYSYSSSIIDKLNALI